MRLRFQEKEKGVRRPEEIHKAATTALDLLARLFPAHADESPLQLSEEGEGSGDL